MRQAIEEAAKPPDLRMWIPMSPPNAREQLRFMHVPAHVVVEGLVLNGMVHKGWRLWALRLGLWLIRKSGCEVVKP